jgi:Icc-related predicted phosphoesterase
MKVTLVSDLHLEFSDLIMPGGDVLIIAGDLCEAKHIKQSQYESDTALAEAATHGNPLKRNDRFYRFLAEECSAKYRETVMVMGNHEHYGFRFEKTANHIRDQLPDNITLLDNSSHVIDDVLFVGGTLWTDLNRDDPVTHQVLTQGMNDYRQITQHDQAKNAYYKLTTRRTWQEHQRTKNFIEKTLKDNRGVLKLPVVVVTHHAPSYLSVSPWYQGDHKFNGGYASDLSALILDNPEIQYWVHGHTHDCFDYTVGSTRVLCNPRGYVGYEQRAKEFDPGFTFEITGAS